MLICQISDVFYILYICLIFHYFCKRINATKKRNDYAMPHAVCGRDRKNPRHLDERIAQCSIALTNSSQKHLQVNGHMIRLYQWHHRQRDDHSHNDIQLRHCSELQARSSNELQCDHHSDGHVTSGNQWRSKNNNLYGCGI